MNRIVKMMMMASAPAKIYGVSWNHGSSPTLTRTDNAVGMVAAAGVDTNTVVNNFDQAEIYKEIVTITDALGNSFVRIPKFYIEKTDDGSTKATCRISKRPFSAACYSPLCFGTDGYAYYGKYPAGKTGSVLTSVSGVYPYVNDTIVNMRTFAKNNGAGYQQLDIHAVDMLQVLFTVEFATLNSQSIMNGWVSGTYAGTNLVTVAQTTSNSIIVANAAAALFAVGQPIGCGTALNENQRFYGRNITSIDLYDVSNKAISFDGAAVTTAVGDVLYNIGWKSGACDRIVANSGGITSLSSGLQPFMYRGIENLWGNVYHFVDGINLQANQAWVCSTPASYASNLFASPYVQLSYANIATSGYLEAMNYDANNPYAQFPKTVGGEHQRITPIIIIRIREI